MQNTYILLKQTNKQTQYKQTQNKHHHLESFTLPNLENEWEDDLNIWFSLK